MLALLLSVVIGLAQTSTAEPLRVRLNWPVGATAAITLERTVEREAGDQTAKWITSEAWLWEIDAHPEAGFVIAHTKRELPVDEWTGSVARDPGMMLTEVLQDMQGALAISPTGKMENIAPGNAMRQLQMLAESAIKAKPNAADTWREALNIHRLKGVAGDRWAVLVGLWVEDPWYLHDQRQRIETDGQGVEQLISRTYQGLVPCEDGGPPTCAEFLLEARPDPKHAREWKAAADAGAKVSPLRLTEDLARIVTVPDGLRPIQARLGRKVTTHFQGPDGRTGAATHTATRIFHFDWTLPSP